MLCLRTGFPTPDASIPRGTLEYYKDKTRLLEKQITQTRKGDLGGGRLAISPVDTMLLQTSWFDPTAKEKSHPIRLTNKWGSFLARDMRATYQVIVEAQELEATKLKEKTVIYRELYARCVGGCTCDGVDCKAAGLYICQCCSPSTVRRGLCQKSICA